MSMKRIVVCLLLMSFFVALSPRSWWHECDNIHRVHQQKDQPGEAHFEKGHCFACDFDLYVADLPVFYELRFAPAVYTSLTVLYQDRISFSAGQVDLRGPPANV